ncbi:DNA-binding response regulator, NarL/FixJ family, contains REC and HTH domains [Parafrankia irregularis]|uniref:DNA-binding response regulator, NarL/FixJ family, contains REC and HTH domains n=1 Tax=Parafrankia irregularis TaxID=795642 RepID=A0A0S4QQV3_9ACTN|nr:response regulator transcription factor [Parafrankia irregularis]MBE3199825.1 response regulator transcription factor [Parafrankia sp. CH37]CUU57975.1 DNA-binding response regulator, NarL/FixJ family, contains REC and HTH domains [Parafrankia irregularis]
MIRVMLADDQALLRVSLAALLNTEPGMQVVGAASNGAEAVRMAAEIHPDVVLMDVRMPGVNGIDATRRITARPATRVIILTSFDLDEYVFAGLRAGASGFLLKDAPPEDLLTAIRVVAAGDALLSPAATRRLIDRFTATPPADGNAPEPSPSRLLLNTLTDRERDVLTRVARGMSNAEIAADLVLATSTIKTHMTNLLAKTSSRDRTQLVIFAYESGLTS